MNRSNYLLCCWLGLLVGFAVQVRAATDDLWNLGPLYERFGLTLDEGSRTEALGPFYYYQTKDETQRTFAVPPLFADTIDPDIEDHETSILYPIITCNRYGSEYRWQCLQLISRSGGVNREGTTNRAVTIFPIFFHQRSPEPDDNYTALFPIYGHLKERLFRDRIFFVLFPIYGQSRQRDIVTDNYLYPFFALRHGNSLFGWQFWPVVGSEHKDVTYKTNGFGETEVIGGHDKFFVAWPFFAKETRGIGTPDLARELDILPLYSQTRSTNRDSTSYLWPFFNFIDDREKKYHEAQTPWPIIVFARGEGKTTSRILPLFSRAHSDVLESDSYLWPAFKYDRLHSGALDRERFRIMFWLFSDLMEKNTETGKVKKRIDLFPLFTWHHDFNGNTRLQILAPVEPILPDNTAIEREWSPVWSLWRSERNPGTGASSQSFLWNLYRHEHSPVSKKCSLLFGLFQYESTADVTRVRLLFVPIVNSKKSPTPVAINANGHEHK